MHHHCWQKSTTVTQRTHVMPARSGTLWVFIFLFFNSPPIILNLSGLVMI